MKPHRWSRWTVAMAVAALTAAGAAAPAAAGRFERVAPVTDAATARECGECHMAYQPGLLPAGAWQRLMADLDHHFGDRASLSPATAAAITAYLTGHAGTGDDRLLRITEQPWYRREHRGGRADHGGGGTIPGASDCQACHAGAARGLYENDDD